MILVKKNKKCNNTADNPNYSSENYHNAHNVPWCDDQLSDEITSNVSRDVQEEEMQYQTPIWNDIKAGVYLLVQFIRSSLVCCRKKSKFSYVCCVINIDDENGGIIKKCKWHEKRKYYRNTILYERQ